MVGGGSAEEWDEGKALISHVAFNIQPLLHTVFATCCPIEGLLDVSEPISGPENAWIV
jgi:hypothetical protein